MYHGFHKNISAALFFSQMLHEIGPRCRRAEKGLYWQDYRRGTRRM